MASSVAIQDARRQLAELFDRAESGEEILIRREGRASMKLVPVPGVRASSHRRVGGQNLLGITHIAPKFDPMSYEELADLEIIVLRQKSCRALQHPERDRAEYPPLEVTPPRSENILTRPRTHPW